MGRPIDPTDFAKDFSRSDAVSHPMLRLELIDSFIAFEVAINRWLFKATGVCEHGQLSVGQRINKLRATDLSKVATTGQIKRFSEILCAVERLLDLRNAIAHGIPRYGAIEGNPAIMLQNSADAAADRPIYFVVAIGELGQASAKLKGFAGEMANWLTPPSPPRPMPGATTGP